MATIDHPNNQYINLKPKPYYADLEKQKIVPQYKSKYEPQASEYQASNNTPAEHNSEISPQQRQEEIRPQYE